MRREEDGPWVRHSDYQREVERLKHERDNWQGVAANFRRQDKALVSHIQQVAKELEMRADYEPEIPRSQAGAYIKGYSKACKDAAALLTQQSSPSPGSRGESE